MCMRDASPQVQKSSDRRELGIRARLLLTFTLLLVCTGGMSVFIAMGAAKQEAKEQLLRQHLLRFDALHKETAESQHPVETLRATGDAAFDLNALVLIGPRMKLVASVGEGARLAQDGVIALAQQSRGRQWRRTTDSNSDARHLFAQSVSISGKRHIIAASFTLGALQRSLGQRQTKTIAFLMFGLALILLFAIYLSGRWVVSPVENLTRLAVDRDDSEQWRTQMQTLDGPKEIKRLATAFGDLVVELRAQNQSLAESMRTLEQAQADLVQAAQLATLGRMSAGLAHEIGNPLAALVGFVDYLRSSQDIDADLRAELFKRIDGESERIRKTIRQLVDVGRPQPFCPTRIVVNELIEQTVDRLSYHSHMKGIHVRIKGQMADGYGDPNRISQVLVNLLLNAAFALDGQGDIDITLREDGAVLLIEVKDEGSGIEPALRDSIFEPFVSSKPAGVGTGLGLFMSRKLMRETRGDLALREGDGSGTVFIISLPRFEDSVTHLQP
ncbi:MAG: sensor histidine kinase [Bradymonadia bacterium]